MPGMKDKMVPPLSFQQCRATLQYSISKLEGNLIWEKILPLNPRYGDKMPVLYCVGESSQHEIQIVPDPAC